MLYRRGKMIIVIRIRRVGRIKSNLFLVKYFIFVLHQRRGVLAFYKKGREIKKEGRLFGPYACFLVLFY